MVMVKQFSIPNWTFSLKLTMPHDLFLVDIITSCFFSFCFVLKGLGVGTRVTIKSHTLILSEYY